MNHRSPHPAGPRPAQPGAAGGSSQAIVNDAIVNDAIVNDAIVNEGFVNEGFVNPWAECWGAAGAMPPPTQMQAEAKPMEHVQMEATVEGAACAQDEAVATNQEADGALVRVLPIINNKGLHARASAKFVQTVERFTSDVKVSRCGETVGGLSIMGLMMLAAARGTSVTVEVRGADAQACMDAIETLVADKFGEEC
jgi:phosphocarrier protein